MELGRVPTRVEYQKYGRLGWKFESVFGSWSVFVTAAGLTAGQALAKTHKENIPFKTDIRTFLQSSNRTETGLFVVERRDRPIIFVPDIHFPFVEPDLFTRFYFFLAQVVGLQGEAIIVVLGDLRDMFAWSKFPRTHLAFNPKEELDLGTEMARQFFAEIKKISPRAETYLLSGNHDIRPLKRVLESAPAIEPLVGDKMREIFTFEGVTTIYDARDHLLIKGDTDRENIITHHGFSRPGAHSQFTNTHFVHGHDHKQYILTKTTAVGEIIEMSCGLFGDPHAKGFTYTPMKLQNWQRGFAFWNEWGPGLVPA